VGVASVFVEVQLSEVEPVLIGPVLLSEELKIIDFLSLTPAQIVFLNMLSHSVNKVNHILV
jgi:hypothetical protein